MAPSENEFDTPSLDQLNQKLLQWGLGVPMFHALLPLLPYPGPARSSELMARVTASVWKLRDATIIKMCPVLFKSSTFCTSLTEQQSPFLLPPPPSSFCLLLLLLLKYMLENHAESLLQIFLSKGESGWNAFWLYPSLVLKSSQESGHCGKSLYSPWLFSARMPRKGRIADMPRPSCRHPESL